MAPEDSGPDSARTRVGDSADQPCPVCGSGSSRAVHTRFSVSLHECVGCGARFVHPVPESNELRKRYESEHGEGKWAELLDQGSPGEPARRATLLTRFVEDPVGEGEIRRLLDVGFGQGGFLDAAAAAGWGGVGLEIAISAARGVAERHPVAVGPLSAVAERQIFSAVTFWDVLEHVSNPSALLGAAVARLRAGGLIAASMPSLGSVTARVEGAAWRYYDLDTYGHLVHMTPEHLQRLFVDAGLRVVHVQTHGSVDLRHSLATRWGRWIAPAGPVLDRLSGLVARWAVPRRQGNTLLVVGRKDRGHTKVDGPEGRADVDWPSARWENRP